MMAEMSILAVLAIPLLASALTVAMSSPRRMEMVYLPSAVASFVAALWLAAEVVTHGTVFWLDGFLYADSLSALMVLLTSFVYLITAPYAVGYFRHDEKYAEKDQIFGESNDGPTSRAKLRSELTEVREAGYAVAVDELEVGLTAAAAPIRSAHGDIIASMSISGPTFRLNDEKLEEAVPMLVAAATEVSHRLGWGQRT